ncbi:MAG: ABC transporter substrate-binding protein [Thermoplasmatota archaeon]
MDLRGKLLTRLFTMIVILLISISFLPGNFADGKDIRSSESEGDYLTAAIMGQIENLNPITIQDVWSAQAARDPIYSGLASTHEDTKKTIPWMAYDWSPIVPSGEGEYDPSETYEDPDPNTVANEAIPSDDLEVIVHLRKDIPFHRSEDWYDSGEMWRSPYSNFEMEGEKMEIVTAQDVVFSAEMTQWKAPLFQSGFLPLEQEAKGDPEDPSDPNWVVNGGNGMYQGVQLIDDHTIRFELDEPYSMFYGGSFPIVLPMNVWDEHTLLDDSYNGALHWDCERDGSIEEQRESIVGNGPFMWSEWDRGKSIRLDKNPDYFADGSRDPDKKEGVSMKNVDLKPTISGLELKVRSYSREAIDSLKNGEVDFINWPLDPTFVEEVEEYDDTDIFNSPDFGFFYLSFNMRKPAFGYKDHPGASYGIGTSYPEDISLNFRKAVTYACDESYFVDDILRGYGKEGHSVVSQDNGMYYNESVERYPYDLQKAEQLLKEQNDIWQEEFSDFPDWNGQDDGWFPLPREDSSGAITADRSEFYLYTPTASYDPDRAKIGLIIARTLRDELSVNIEARSKTFSSLVGILDPGRADFDMFMLGWSIGGFESLGSLEAFFHSRNDKPGGYNMPGFRNERFDELVEDAEMELNQTKKAEIVKELQGIISEELPYNVLYYRDQTEAYRKEWQGWVNWPGGVWNSFSWGNVYKQRLDGTGVEIHAPKMVNESNSCDLSITIENQEEEPIPNIKADLELSNPDAELIFWDRSETNADGMINATLLAPEIDSTETVELTVKIPEGRYSFCSETIEKKHHLTINPVELEEMTLDAAIEDDSINVDQQADISLNIDSTSSTENVTVFFFISPCECGANIPEAENDSGKYMIQMGSDLERTVRFEAHEVTKGKTGEFKITVLAEKQGYTSCSDELYIEVEGEPIDEGEGDSLLPFLTTPMLMVLMVFLAVLYRRKCITDDGY